MRPLVTSLLNNPGPIQVSWAMEQVQLRFPTERDTGDHSWTFPDLPAVIFSTIFARGQHRCSIQVSWVRVLLSTSRAPHACRLADTAICSSVCLSVCLSQALAQKRYSYASSRISHQAMRCPSVCPSVCPSHSCEVRRN